MDDFSKAYLSYARASLADARCPSPELQADVVEITSPELNRGKVGAQALRALLEIARRQRFDEDDEERLWPISLAVCPRVYAVRPEHSRSNSLLPLRLAPVVLFAQVDRFGTFSVDSANSQPVIPRELLRPTRSVVALGELEAADKAHAKLAVCGTWRDLLSAALALLAEVSCQAADELAIEGYELYPQALCRVESRKPPATVNILKLIDLALTRPPPSLPLCDALLRDAKVQANHEIKQDLDLLRLSARHLGQAESRYGLSSSQRETLLTILANEPGQEIIAVDGPPGTGKTTLLLSVVATNWVACALANYPAPVTVATSTNNQSVLNVLEAFARTQLGSGPLYGRWLPGIESYGISLPARGKEDLASAKSFKVHVLTGQGKEADHPARHFETPENFALARIAFLQQLVTVCSCSAEISLAEAVDLLRARIKAAVDEVQVAVDALLTLSQSTPSKPLSGPMVAHLFDTAERDYRESVVRQQTADAGVKKALQLRQSWKRHVGAELWWISLLALCKVASFRRARDGAFCADAELEFGELIQSRLRHVAAREDIDRAIEDLLARLEAERESAFLQVAVSSERFTRLRAARDTVRAHVPEADELTIESVQTALDKGPRVEAFSWATHYWEAKYLLVLEQAQGDPAKLRESKSREGMERQYRRLAMLWPCFVSTLYVLPARFTGWKLDDQPLYNTIDLLIVDEAGQVPPDIGAASFMLARRALVVGDVDQLSPIWGVKAVVDAPNALRHKVVGDERQAEQFLDSGMAASAGSLMRLAQRATPFVKYPERGRGLFLSEHRRCLPPIIEICNDMVYSGLLVACRKSGVPKPFPTVGYVHIPGRGERVGVSWKNETEAHAIARWLTARKAVIEETFSQDGKRFGQLVSVVTPFNAQARLIRRALTGLLGKDHGVTVGTVDTLQGAERRIVIFSPTYGLGTTPGQTRFDRERSVLNVTISRAQDAFLVFGNMHLFQPGSRRPSAYVANALFADPDNELDGVDVELLRPSPDLSDGVLIADLESHREVLAEALATAKSLVVIASPFLTSSALAADGLEDKIKSARRRGVLVRVVTDVQLNYSRRADFEKSKRLLHASGADVRIAATQGVHSKLLLVDRSWLVVGSFNWLSAVRQPNSRYRRYESSLQYRGEEAFDMIERSLTDLQELTRAAP